MTYSPTSEVTLTGEEMNNIVSMMSDYKEKNNTLIENNEDYIQKDIQNQSELDYLESELDKARFEAKKTIALNKVLLKQYATNKSDKAELESQKVKSIVCASNYASILAENNSLKEELKQALELIAKTKEYRV
ncbi:MAG: hypothetical protein U9N34_01540 [Candidatus Cloacimonadota bacterium]|nr:hypothetical protein [Candidatus Cloacimonadota bacterium]